MCFFGEGIGYEVVIMCQREGKLVRLLDCESGELKWVVEDLSESQFLKEDRIYWINNLIVFFVIMRSFVK